MANSADKFGWQRFSSCEGTVSCHLLANKCQFTQNYTNVEFMQGILRWMGWTVMKTWFRVWNGHFCYRTCQITYLHYVSKLVPVLSVYSQTPALNTLKSNLNDHICTNVLHYIFTAWFFIHIPRYLFGRTQILCLGRVSLFIQIYVRW